MQKYWVRESLLTDSAILLGKPQEQTQEQNKIWETSTPSKIWRAELYTDLSQRSDEGKVRFTI